MIQKALAVLAFASKLQNQRLTIQEVMCENKLSMPAVDRRIVYLSGTRSCRNRNPRRWSHHRRRMQRRSDCRF